MSKSAKYIVVIAVLLGANITLFFSDGEDSVKKSEKYFLSEDIDDVSRFIFAIGDDSTVIERLETGWVLNNKFKADEGFVNTLISVLRKIEIGKTIEGSNVDVLGSIEVEFGYNSRYSFKIGTNPTKTKSYFLANEIAKEVSVPGYRDNVVDIFTLHPDQWRDRTILDGSWRTIQKVEVENARGEDFQISFQDKFFLLNGQQPSDSSAVVDYLNQFQVFQANEMISVGRFEEMDSLAGTTPFAQITIEDIKSEEPIILQIFPNKQDRPYHLVMDQDGQQMVIDAHRVGRILANPDN